jgi:predicted AAA+ superfamily ATPase
MRRNKEKIMLKRKIWAKLEAFKANADKKTLLLTGARQVGKTYIVEQFAKAKYESFVEINFVEDPVAKAIFHDVADEKDVLRRITAYAQGKIIPGETLVLFDEVQECPEAVTYAKFLVDKGGCHYIYSGSLLGVELKNVRSVPVGYMDEEEMFPLDFEEFLTANGESEDAISEAKAAFEGRRAVDAFIHDRLMRYFKLYLVVGGMPAAVQKYVDTNDLAAVAAEQRSVIRAYRRDISKYDPDHALRIREIYDLLPPELASENKRFKMSNVVPDSRFSRVEDGFLWLKSAGVAIPAYCVEEPKAPLRLSEKRNLFKLFANDVGLLAAMYAEGIQLRIVAGESTLNIGAVYENAVAQELRAHGFSPYYYHSKKRGELDFVVENAGSAIPIEVKSGKDYKRHNALQNVLMDTNYPINEAIVLSNENLEQIGKITYAPVYMVMFVVPDALPDKLIYRI